jgi:hypothetical protein
LQPRRRPKSRRKKRRGEKCQNDTGEMGRHGVHIAQESGDRVGLDRVESKAKSGPRVKIRISVKTMPGDGSAGHDRLEGGPAAEGAVRQSHLKDLRQGHFHECGGRAQQRYTSHPEDRARSTEVSAIATPAMFLVPTREASPMQKAWKEEIPLCAPPRDETPSAVRSKKIGGEF